MALLCFVALLLHLFTLSSASQTLRGVTAIACADPLGMKDNTIPDNAITASTFYEPSVAPSHARLDSSSGWAPAYKDKPNEWIQVDLQSNKKVTGIAIQGLADSDFWVKSYTVKHSADGLVFSDVKDFSGKTKVFIGSFNRNSYALEPFDLPIVTRYIRIYPKTWKTYRGIRFEVFGWTDEHTTIACENSAALEIACNAGNVINIISANYGRTKPDSEICPGGPNNKLDCVSTSSFDKVKEICQGKTSCEVNPTNSVFGDPCAYTYKYLLITHTCEPLATRPDV